MDLQTPQAGIDERAANRARHIAVIGAGISGLGCAWLLSQRHQVTVFEAAARIGGHCNTIDVPHGDRRIPVDTGFIVYNELNYPNLTRLLAAFDVPTRPSDMSFGVSIGGGRLEYAGGSARALFVQSRNLVNLGFHRMLLDVARFQREGRAALARGVRDDTTLRDFLDQRGFSAAFRQRYLLPMAAAIWSGSTAGMLDFPLAGFLRFFANHGLLSTSGQPQWRTVCGGSRTYVGRLRAAIHGEVRTSAEVVGVRRTGQEIEVCERNGWRTKFDHVVLACHADQALALLEDPGKAEVEVLSSFRYRDNLAVIHSDPRLMPKRRSAWASWNYLASGDREDGAEVGVTYWMNRLQAIDPACQVFVSLNPATDPKPSLEIARFAYAHPQFTTRTERAQRRLHEIQGRFNTWYCGAHWGFGFHEDGLKSGLEVAAALGVPAPWWSEIEAPVAGSAISLPLPATARPE